MASAIQFGAELNVTFNDGLFLVASIYMLILFLTLITMTLRCHTLEPTFSDFSYYVNIFDRIMIDLVIALV